MISLNLSLLGSPSGAKGKIIHLSAEDNDGIKMLQMRAVRNVKMKKALFYKNTLHIIKFEISFEEFDDRKSYLIVTFKFKILH